MIKHLKDTLVFSHYLHTVLENTAFRLIMKLFKEPVLLFHQEC
jgi:hypothetical protein